ncbi:nucleotide disphospho-sugar-binding domain-containing protein [Amycolatopsis sp. cmx-4-68]|uniref:nucleotide disphospho-sugar-binding domain-containing protein n=1 Tax=Amycolatopsis sp. cmx-4-68 TaxID=2790938 RepID=UPI00397D7F64
MKVLFTVIAERTIFCSMVPLAWALRTAGHEVRVACQPAFAPVVTQAGLTAVPVGRDATIWRMESLDPELLERARAGLPSPWRVVEDPANADWEELREGHRVAVDEGHKLENFPLIGGLAEFARTWEPDLVVWEPLTYAGPIAAKACGAAHARLLWSIDVFGATREIYHRTRPAGGADPLADWLGGYGRKYGFEFSEDMTTGQFSIDPVPPSIGLRASGLDYRPMQYVPYGGPAASPGWLRPTRPRIGLTLGTTATERFGGYVVDVAETLAELSTLDVEVVATVKDPAFAVPDNARVVPFVPLDALAPTCDVVIDHAGPGTFLTVARHGVPQLTVPWDFDEPELARRAAAQGGSLTIRGDRATGVRIREGVERLLAEPSFGTRAAELRDELRGLPSPNDVAEEIEALVEKNR